MPNIVILDVETTFTVENKKTNPSPYIPTNKLVSVGLKVNDKEIEYFFVNHKERVDLGSFGRIQAILDAADLVVAHNAKFDMSWLFECNFKYTGKLYDSMILEYIISKGQKPSLSLADCCTKYGLTPKKDILKEYIAKGVNVDEIPAAELKEYGLGDIQSTYELYLKQQELIENTPEIKAMMPAIELSMKALAVLISMERTGIYINQEALKTVELEYRLEAARLEKLMQEMVIEVMGHRPINLNSSEHLSWVIYSRKVNDKKAWADIFNIGTEERGSVFKPKYLRRYSFSKFRNLIVENMTTLHRQDAEQCSICAGKGKIQKVKVDGTPFKNLTNCSSCGGNGFTYIDRPEHAGFKVTPIDSTYATSSGFATDKQSILDLIASGKLKGKAQEFLECLSKHNSIQSYLSTFVEGIQRNIRQDLMLHTSLNQCVTATGRLSSSNPNFQNLPRGKTFPVRKVIQSRFEGGWILEADFAQLEFRTAAMLSGCEVALKDIIDGLDVHTQTMNVITSAGQTIDRQVAKIHTFKPTFGGETGTEAEKAYYKFFLDKYIGIKNYQNRLLSDACGKHEITIPSGRTYAFPNARRIGPDRIIGKNQILNYPIQGFAGADIAWVVLLDIYEQMVYNNTKSKLILQVHDSFIADVHPDEKDLMIEIFKSSFNRANELLIKHFNFKTEVPIGYDLAIGRNLMEKEKVA